MIIRGWYDEKAGNKLQAKSITAFKLKQLKSRNKFEFNQIAEQLHIQNNKNIKLVPVCRKGKHFFRKKGLGLGNTTNSDRGENESREHFAYKEAISRLKSFSFKYNDDTVRVFVKSAKTEVKVKCVLTSYVVDIELTLERTEPANYMNLFNGKLYIEIYKKHTANTQKTVDFSIENKMLFEYKVSEKFNIMPTVSENTQNNIINSIVRRMEEDAVGLVPLSDPIEQTNYNWKITEKNNLYTKYKEEPCTIAKNNYGPGYIIFYGKNKKYTKHFGKTISSVEVAKKIANAIFHNLKSIIFA